MLSWLQIIPAVGWRVNRYQFLFASSLDKQTLTNMSDVTAKECYRNKFADTETQNSKATWLFAS